MTTLTPFLFPLLKGRHLPQCLPFLFRRRIKTVSAIGVEINMLGYITGRRRIALQPSPSCLSKTIILTPTALRVS